MEVKGGRAGLVGRGLTRLDQAVSISMCLSVYIYVACICIHAHIHTCARRSPDIFNDNADFCEHVTGQ